MPEDGDSFLARRSAELRENGWTVPFGYEDLEREASESLPRRALENIHATPGLGATARANRQFDRWEIVPRVFRDVTECSLETELFGQQVPAPIALAPIGRQAIYHPDGERASARAAASLSVPFALSTVSSVSIETVAEEIGDAPRIFQLYWTEDWDLTAELLERAERAGYAAILVTVDFQARRWIPENIADSEAPEFGTANANFAGNPEEDPAWDKTVTWADLSFLREHTDLPIYLKGIVHPEDARLAVEHGADGIVVSNHGARQTDGSIGTIGALPDVVDAVDGRLPVLFDSGIRCGADVFKALALGADGVFLGRPYLLGLALAGERGVYETVHNYLAELESIVGLAGYTSVDAIDRDVLRRVRA